MTYSDQNHYEVRCEWGMAAVQNLSASDVVIIVDVLSFSSCVEIALTGGATIFPYRWNDNSAAEYARKMSAELAGARDDVAARYSLSPCSLICVTPGLRLVLPSPNGSSLAFTAIEHGASVVLAGCLRNASAVALVAQSHGNRINVVPAGERWPDGSLRPAIEDIIGAGAIIKRLSGRLSPEASAAVAVFDDASTCLEDRIMTCSSGRELVTRGFRRDVTVAAEHDVSKVVPELVDSAFVRSRKVL